MSIGSEEEGVVGPELDFGKTRLESVSRRKECLIVACTDMKSNNK